MPNASVSLATVEVGAIRWVTDQVEISDGIHLELVPGRERRALVHIPGRSGRPSTCRCCAGA